MNESRKVHIERTIKLKELLQKGDISVSLASEKSGVNRMTINNLKNDKVDPEKMNDATLLKVSNFVNSPANPINNLLDQQRDYYFGQLLAVTELLLSNIRSGYGLKQDELETFSKRPATTFQRMHEKIVSANIKEYLELQDEIMSIVNQFDPNDFDDTPLSPKYLVAYYRKKGEMKEDKNYFKHIKGYGFQNKNETEN
jgi:transcriptional regulator with XRE-family HTH domain